MGSVLLYRRRQLLHGCRGFFQCTGLLFGTGRQIVVAVGNLGACRGHAVRVLAHALHHLGQGGLHAVQGIEQQRNLVPPGAGLGRGVRLPSATARATCTAASSGRTTARLNSRAVPMPSTQTVSITTRLIQMARVASVPACAATAAALRWISTGLIQQLGSVPGRCPAPPGPRHRIHAGGLESLVAAG
jgi:hypothetical protein